ncbi:putative clathrin assembly protein At5g35200 isoform X2 [Argentina anserina]|uniref:putative clathrin assembly protein At5g35200 isoform X2 n=1 Tax=Argentina anserina TaxID=57926 RepID=UPI0021762FDD|nr:putative clathrin assembly protein At5g35200 isoform X2 [Potentilla anserina]
MAAGAGSQQSLRKALKTVGLAKANGDFKVLDIAIAKATKHGDGLPKEKHVITILHAIPASRPRAEVAYCIHALAKRLSKAHSWKVALKTVIVIHRALREVDDTFCDALIKYSWSKGHILNISHSWDETSPSAWGYSTWVRLYASYLEERLECFRVLKYDVQKDHSRTKGLETPDLLRQLPALQQLLSRLLDCQVAGESAKLYAAITDGIVNLVDKFFEMQRDDAVRALELYKKSGNQAERLSEFFETCRSLNFGRGMKIFKIQQPPQSFLTTMEDYVKETSGIVMLQLPLPEDQTDAPKETVVIEGDLLVDPDDNVEDKSASEHPRDDQSEAAAARQIVDLLSFDEVIPVISESDENNSMALAIVPSENPPDPRTDGLDSTTSNSSWEIELFNPPTSNGASAQQTPSTSTTQTKLIQAGKLDRSTLDSLYDMASTPNQNNMFCSPAAMAPSNPFEDVASSSYQFQDSYHASSNATTPTNLQMGLMAQQQQYFMLIQQQKMQQLHLSSTVPNIPSHGQNKLTLYQNLPSPSHNPPSPFHNLPNPFQSPPSPGQNPPSLHQNLPSPGYNPSSLFQNLPSPLQNPPSPLQNPPSPLENQPNSLTSSGNPFSDQISTPPQNSDNGLI